MKSIKSKIQISMLSVVLLGSVLIGVITALLNASGIDDVMEKTLGPATQMAADAVEWKMGTIGQLSKRLPPLIFFGNPILRLRSWSLSGKTSPSVTVFFTLAKWMPTGFLLRDTTTLRKIISKSASPQCSLISLIS